jgi:hypothetical protein
MRTPCPAPARGEKLIPNCRGHAPGRGIQSSQSSPLCPAKARGRGVWHPGGTRPRQCPQGRHFTQAQPRPRVRRPATRGLPTGGEASRGHIVECPHPPPCHHAWSLAGPTANLSWRSGKPSWQSTNCRMPLPSRTLATGGRSGRRTAKGLSEGGNDHRLPIVT